MFRPRPAILCVAFIISVLTCNASSQQTISASCNFDDGNQITVRYQSVPVSDHKLPDGKVWSPGESPMFLFTSVALRLGNAEIPVGAYSMYVIPSKGRWTLALNKNVTPNAQYDQQQDLARVPMDIGTLTDPAKTVSIYFGHVAAKQCNMRIYYGKTGAWTEFHER